MTNGRAWGRSNDGDLLKRRGGARRALPERFAFCRLCRAGVFEDHRILVDIDYNGRSKHRPQIKTTYEYGLKLDCASDSNSTVQAAFGLGPFYFSLLVLIFLSDRSSREKTSA